MVLQRREQLVVAALVREGPLRLAVEQTSAVSGITARSLWRWIARYRAWPATAALLLLLAASPAQAQGDAALATRLAYVVTGDAAVDGVSRAGLAGLSSYVNRRTAASLAEPAAVTPGQDDLSLYPLLYWPLTADAAPPAGATPPRPPQTPPAPPQTSAQPPAQPPAQPRR